MKLSTKGQAAAHAPRVAKLPAVSTMKSLFEGSSGLQGACMDAQLQEDPEAHPQLHIVTLSFVGFSFLSDIEYQYSIF